MLVKEDIELIAYNNLQFSSTFYRRYSVSDYKRALEMDEVAVVTAYSLSCGADIYEDLQDMHTILQKDVNLLKGYDTILLISSNSVGYGEDKILLPLSCKSTLYTFDCNGTAPLKGQPCCRSFMVLCKNGTAKDSIILYRVKDAFTNYVDFDIKATDYPYVLEEINRVPIQMGSSSDTRADLLADTMVSSRFPYLIARNLAFKYVTSLVDNGYYVLGALRRELNNEDFELSLRAGESRLVELSNMTGDVGKFTE